MPERALYLPEDFIVPEKRIKRSPQPADFDLLQDEQRTAAEQLMAYIEGETNQRMWVLKGYAGTGKTFTMGHIQDWLLYAKKFKVACSAPTNKAVQVIKDLCEISDPKLTFATIHSLLGLKESYDYNGRLKFIPDPHNPPSLKAYDVLFIDEASMFDDDLFQLINPFADEGVKIIFVGDPAQIPPVNRIDCIPFIRKKQLEYKIGESELTTIRRQANDHPLLHFATQIREQRAENEFNFDYDIDVRDGMGLLPMAKQANDLIYQVCDTYFANNIFSVYPDFMKVIAWRNITVNAVNAKVRELIYKEHVPKDPKLRLPALMPGEKMIADKPIKDSKGYIILTTNTEFVVKNYGVKSTQYIAKIGENVYSRNHYKYYETEIEAMTPKGVRKHTIRIIHEDSLQQYNHDLEFFKINVAKIGNPGMRAGAWRAYYDMVDVFAQVKYNYAITAHKSQGSSYENCMMIEWDMYQNTRYEERNRIRYVAATRARKYLFIVK